MRIAISRSSFDNTAASDVRSSFAAGCGSNLTGKDVVGELEHVVCVRFARVVSITLVTPIFCGAIPKDTLTSLMHIAASFPLEHAGGEAVPTPSVGSLLPQQRRSGADQVARLRSLQAEVEQHGDHLRGHALTPLALHYDPHRMEPPSHDTEAQVPRETDATPRFHTGGTTRGLALAAH